MASNRDRAYAPLVYESLPPEVIDVCTNCMRTTCPGYCDAVLEAERMHIPGRSGSGYSTRTYPYRGGEITVKQMCDKLSASKSVVYRLLDEGLSMEEIHRQIRKTQNERRARKRRAQKREDKT